MFLDRFRLDGKVALITGGGRGIALAIAEALADCGAAVVLQDIDLPVAQAAAQNIRASGGRATAIGGDINDLTLPQRVVDESIQAFGGLHILVNSASIQSYDPSWLNFTVETMQREFSADVISPIRFCQSAARVFKEQRFGRIINIGSIQQQRGYGNMLSYSLSKAAIEKLTVVLARELVADGITVNCIAPGWFNTYRNRQDFPDQQALEKNGKRIPMGRVGEPIDCAGLALLLCSQAGEYITGQSIFVDGGQSVR